MADHRKSSSSSTMTAKTKHKRQGTVCLTQGKRTTLKRF
jgi:hypothetical protein